MTLDLDEVMEAAQRDDFTGFCRACGYEQAGIEADARKDQCDNCRKPQVYGAEQLCIMLM